MRRSETPPSEIPPELQWRALRSASTAILVIDRGRRVIWANEAAETLTGYSVEQLRQLPSTASLTPEPDHPRRDESWSDVLSGRQRTNSGVTIVRQDGGRVTVGGSWKSLRDANGEFSCAIAELWRREEARSADVAQQAG